MCPRVALRAFGLLRKVYTTIARAVEEVYTSHQALRSPSLAKPHPRARKREGLVSTVKLVRDWNVEEIINARTGFSSS